MTSDILTTPHKPVLLERFLSLVDILPNGIYVDCTYGGGGHSKGILDKLNDNGKLYAFDQDELAMEYKVDDNRVKLFRYNFRHIGKILKLEGVEKVDGILADLGVSSFQIDDPKRGFSFQHSNMIDMRMDNRLYDDAWTFIQKTDKIELGNILSNYGEIPKAKMIADVMLDAIKKADKQQAVKIISEVAKRFRGDKPKKLLAQIFQAIRIHINDELKALKDLVDVAPQLLKINGWMAIISFHSLEDRIVKRTFKNWENNIYEKNATPVISTQKKWEDIGVNPVVPNSQEIANNPRASSAKMRIAKLIL